ncbi:MAG: hypothetical protein WAO52_02740 [Prolixibacteraceae bacterium]
MTSKGQIKIVLVFIFSIIFNLSSLSQNRKYFVINGKINSAIENSENCSLHIIKNNSRTFNSQIPENGRFRLELEYNSNFTLIFKKKNHQSKTIQVNTTVPEEVLNRSGNFANFLMTVTLNEGDENAASQIQQIGYSSQDDCFAQIQSDLKQEFVEKENQNQNSQIKENKSKFHSYQVF